MRRGIRQRLAGRGRAASAIRLLALAAVAGSLSLGGCGSQTAGSGSLRSGRLSADGTAATAGGGSVRSGSGLPGSDGRAGPAVSGSRDSSGNGPSGVSGGALFGGNYPLVSEEPNLGRQLAIVRLYYYLGDAFPGPTQNQELLSSGHTLLVSFDSSKYTYASIAAGKEDSLIISALQAVNQAAVQYHLGAIYISFEHEPDNSHHRWLGSPAQFVQAWDHVHWLAESAHLDWNDGGRLHWVLILIHNTYDSWRMGSFWPGADEVDIVAADGYNSYGCSSVKKSIATPSDTFGPLVGFATAHGIPAFAAEWGSVDIPSGTQAQYINQMQSYVANNSVLAGALYWDTRGSNCNYQVNGNSSSISALAAMGQSAALQGHV